MLKPFLTANWRYLAMLNFVADPTVLIPLLPKGTELDFHDGKTFVSVVGFLFLDTRIFGLPIPLHRDFEEVNLRYYVRQKNEHDCRRGVAFVRELVPKRAIAIIARAFYGEPYSALPMRHSVEHKEARVVVEYQWQRARGWETLSMTATGEPQAAKKGGHEEFITEHYWGYTALTSGSSEYRVEHPVWKLWPAESFRFEADVALLYGQQFVGMLSAPPASAFIADGSPVSVLRRRAVISR